MEKEWFDWEEWEQVDNFILQFLNCTIKKPFGPYNVGDKVAVICIAFDSGVIECYNNTENSEEDPFIPIVSYAGKVSLNVN